MNPSHLLASLPELRVGRDVDPCATTRDSRQCSHYFHRGRSPCMGTFPKMPTLGTYGDSEREYPGKVRSFGVGVGCQRFHWRNAYTTLEATPFVQQLFDEAHEPIQKGFQLYCQLVLGYRFDLFGDRFYVEPAWALKYWPVNTNFPDAFAEIEQGAPNHIFEPAFTSE